MGSLIIVIDLGLYKKKKKRGNRSSMLLRSRLPYELSVCVSYYPWNHCLSPKVDHRPDRVVWIN